MRISKCPLCSSRCFTDFYHRENVPVHVNVVYHTREEALNCPIGTISLAVCHNCGLIFNRTCNPNLTSYHEEYNNNRNYSAYYEKYIQNIIELIRHNLNVEHKKVLELGSGDGQFLIEFCSATNSQGLGIDPAYKGSTKIGNVKFVSDYFKPEYIQIRLDVLILRHILEHVSQPREFFATLIHDGLDIDAHTVIEVPDFKWISHQGSYWDIFYEHCNYFTAESITNLMALSATKVTTIDHAFNGQYLVAFGKSRGHKSVDLVAPQMELVQEFLNNIDEQKSRLYTEISKGPTKLVVWGAAGKGVTFLNELDHTALNQVQYTVDINREKQGCYCPCTGLEIVAPEKLNEERDKYTILIMNSNYLDEIDKLLSNFGIDYNLVTFESSPRKRT